MMEKNLKIGVSVDNIPTIFPSKNGEERGVIIYKRKATYKDDPYSSKKNSK